MLLKPCMKNLTHSLLQQGPDMRQRGMGAPPSATCSSDSQKVWSDSVRQSFTSPTATVQTGTPQTPVSGITSRALHYRQVASNRLKSYQPWSNHISVPVVVDNLRGWYCKYNKCRFENCCKETNNLLHIRVNMWAVYYGEVIIHNMCTLQIEEGSHDYSIFDGIFRRYTIIDVYILVWYLIIILTTIIIYIHTFARTNLAGFQGICL